MMKHIIQQFIHCLMLAVFAAIFSLSFYKTAMAQQQIVGDPATCPLCNPPLEIVKIRGMNDNLIEFPVMHLYEGERSSSEHRLTHIEIFPREDPYIRDMSNLNDVMRSRLSDYIVDGVYDPYMFINPYVRIISQSAPNTLVLAESTFRQSALSKIPSDTYVMNIQAGAPGKTAVAWLYGSIIKASMLRGTSDSTQLNFIQAVVVHPSRVPLFVQEITLPAGEKPVYVKFKLDEQKPLERIKILVNQCDIFYWPIVYKPNESPVIHSISGYARNCADLISVQSYQGGKLKETKRILLIVNDGSIKNGLPKVTIDYFENKVFMRPVKNKTSTVEKKLVSPGN